MRVGPHDGVLLQEEKGTLELACFLPCEDTQDGHLQARKNAPTRHRTGSTLSLHFPDWKTGRNRGLLFQSPVHGSLFQQPELAKESLSRVRAESELKRRVCFQQ